MATLNDVLHSIAHAVGMNTDHPVHAEIDDAVPPEKEEPKDEEKEGDEEADA